MPRQTPPPTVVMQGKAVIANALKAAQDAAELEAEVRKIRRWLDEALAEVTRRP